MKGIQKAWVSPLLKRIPVFIFIALSTLGIPSFSQDAKWKQYQTKGDTLYNHEDYKGAISWYTKSISASKLKDKESYGVVYKRAVCYYSTNEFEKALHDLETFIPQYPDAPRPRLLRAFVYRELGDEDNQLVNLDEAIRLQLISPPLLKWRGTLHLQKDDYAKAKQDFLWARELEDDAEIETYLGLTYYHLERKDSAFMSFNRSIELDPLYVTAYLYAGSIALESGDYATSLKYLDLALRLDPKNKEALFYKGAVLVEQKKIDEGCRCLNRAFYAGMDEAGDYLTEYCYDVDN